MLSSSLDDIVDSEYNCRGQMHSVFLYHQNQYKKNIRAKRATCKTTVGWMKQREHSILLLAILPTPRFASSRLASLRPAWQRCGDTRHDILSGAARVRDAPASDSAARNKNRPPIPSGHPPSAARPPASRLPPVCRPPPACPFRRQPARRAACHQVS